MKEGAIMATFRQCDLDEFLFNSLIDLGYIPTEEEVQIITDIVLDFMSLHGATILYESGDE